MKEDEWIDIGDQYFAPWHHKLFYSI